MQHDFLGQLSNLTVDHEMEDQSFCEAAIDLVNSFCQVGIGRRCLWFGVDMGATAAECGVQSFDDSVSDSFLDCPSDCVLFFCFAALPMLHLFL